MSISQVVLFVTSHPWCFDVERDEAVRAAEDGRQGHLPTLEDCIGMLPKSGSASSWSEHKNKGKRMGTKPEQAVGNRRKKRKGGGP